MSNKMGKMVKRIRMHQNHLLRLRVVMYWNWHVKKLQTQESTSTQPVKSENFMSF